MSDILFSVIVPTYNRAPIIRQTIDSLLNQEYSHFEIIVVDDGSTDDTESVVKAIADNRVSYHKKQNAERAAARNFGARLAKGEFVNFFDSDDIAQPNHLAEAARLLMQYPDAKWFHLGYAWAGPGGKVFRKVDHYRGDTLNHYMASGNPLSCNGVFLQKATALAFPFNEDRDLSASEDYELWCRLAARFPLYYTNTVTSLVIDHESRSVRTINGEKLIRRLELLVGYLSADEKVPGYFGAGFDKIKMDSNSYIALHLANEKAYKLKSVHYLWKAFRDSASLVKTKRFYATIKNIVLKW